MRRLYAMFPFGLLLFIAPWRAIAGQEATSQIEWVSFETIPQSAMPIVYARLNGGQGYRMAMDLSVHEVLLDEFIVVGSGMELEGRGEIQVIDYYGPKEKVPVVYLDTLSLGSVEKRGVKTLLIQGDDLGSAAGIPIYGRVGRDFLETFRLTIYYPRKLLLVESSPEKDVPTGGVSFQEEERALSVQVVVNGGITERFVVDPALSFTTLDRKWATSHGLAPKDANRVDLDSLQIGGLVLREVPALLENMKRLRYRERPAGVIGASLLRELAVTYDFPRGLLWLRNVEGSSN